MVDWSCCFGAYGKAMSASSPQEPESRVGVPQFPQRACLNGLKTSLCGMTLTFPPPPSRIKSDAHKASENIRDPKVSLPSSAR